MDFSQQPQGSPKRVLGGALVLLLHVGVVYVLLTGLGRKIVEAVRPAVAARIIEEPKPIPPPPLPSIPQPQPKPVKVQRHAPPPPRFVPRPEVRVAAPAAREVTTAVPNAAPELPRSAPEVVPPTAPEPAPAVVAKGPPVRVAAVIDGRACGKPEYPRSSFLNEEEGVVTLEFVIGTDGQVLESRVIKSSGFKELDRAAQGGLSLCKFKPGSVDGKPEQSTTTLKYAWKLN